MSFIVEALEIRGTRPRIRAALARSFEYYSGVILRVDAGGRRLLGGGRYDELIGLVGGKRVPASGFALFVDPIVALLGDRATPAMDRILVTPSATTPAAVAEALAVATAMRAAGLRAETIEGSGSPPKARVICDDGGGYRVLSTGTTTTCADMPALLRAVEALL